MYYASLNTQVYWLLSLTLTTVFIPFILDDAERQQIILTP